MAINRALLQKDLHMSYSRHESMKDIYCFYCNSLANGRDHCPALSHAKAFQEYERILFRCCYLCNSLLGDIFLLTPFKRLEFLKEKYKKRWKKDIDLPDWSAEEIDQLEGQLKREIIKATKRKKRAVDVLSNIEKRIEVFLEDM